jgi:hypothetical protein
MTMETECKSLTVLTRSSVTLVGALDLYLPKFERQKLTIKARKNQPRMDRP